MTKPYVPLSDEAIQDIKQYVKEHYPLADIFDVIEDRNYWKAEYEALLVDAKLCADTQINDIWDEAEVFAAAKRIEGR